MIVFKSWLVLKGKIGGFCFTLDKIQILLGLFLGNIGIKSSRVVLMRAKAFDVWMGAYSLGSLFIFLMAKLIKAIVTVILNSDWMVVQV